MRRLFPFPLAVLLVATGWATTLEKLSVDEMVQKSTAIARGRVSAVSATERGPVIYTVYRLQVSEVLKGPLAPGPVDVYVPGGVYRGYRQRISGSPTLAPGVEYVVFLWTSPRGLTQVIGLSQGVFEIKQSALGEQMLVRGRVEADFVDASGRPVEDQGVKLTVRMLEDRIRRLILPREAQE